MQVADTEKANPTPAPPPFPWLTGEIALYGLIACLALVMRLGGLGLRTVDVPEAEQAWQAWRLANGAVPTGSYSPLLLSGQALLFALFGASDYAARLLPALAGSVVVILPYFMRSRLGAIGSLVAASALAISPTLVYSSRYGDGTMLLVAGGLGLAVLWLAYRADGMERRVAYLDAIAVIGALALLSEPRVVSVLILFALAWGVERWLFGRDLFALSAGAHPIPWKRLGLISGATLVLVATAFAFNPGGLGAWADYVSAWGKHWAPVINGQPWYYPLLALLLYEPFILIFGLIGALDAILRRDESTPWVWIAGGLLLLSLLMGGRDAGDVGLLCFPLALFAGRAVGDLVHSWQRDALWTREGIAALIVLGVLVYVAFEASFYARSLYLSLPEATQFLWFWLLAVALIIVLAGLSLAWFGMDITWRAGGAVVAVAALLSTFSAATGLNYFRAQDPRELHILSAPAKGTRDALAVMADVSYHQRGSPNAMSVTVETHLGPVWSWYLRDWEDVTWVDDLSPDVATPMVLSSEHWRPPGRYVGQDFITRWWWQPRQLYSNDPLSWWLYRQSVTKPTPIQKVILWVKADDQITE